LTDFPNFISVVHSSNCDRKHSLNIPPHLKSSTHYLVKCKFQVTIDNPKNISRKRQQPAEFVENGERIFEKRSTFAKVMGKNQVSCFLLTDISDIDHNMFSHRTTNYS